MNKLFVIIDPGHGVNTPGKRSPDGQFREYQWNRDFAKMLSNRLHEIGIDNDIIVPEENDVTLKARCDRANILAKTLKFNNIDSIYVSIHVNAGPDNTWSNASGVTTHVYKDGSSKSKTLGKIYADNAHMMQLEGNRYIPKTGYYECNFYVCKHTNMPAILVEHMFMTNKEDIKFLESEEGKKSLIQLHETSILNYMKKYNYAV